MENLIKGYVYNPEKEKKYDILHEVLEEIFEEKTKEIENYFNSFEFRNDLLDRMEEKGINILFVDDELTTKVGRHEIPKYLINTDEMCDEIVKDVMILEEP